MERHKECVAANKRLALGERWIFWAAPLDDVLAPEQRPSLAWESEPT